jgi:hypothetical protein
MARAAALALAFLALMAGPAQGRATTGFEVVVVPGFTLDDLEGAQGLGAVGLLNPGAGPETSAELAEGSLVRGEVRNSLRDGLPAGPPLLSFTRGQLGSVDGPAIYLGLPEGGRQSNDSRYPILVVGPGFEGLLSSDSTRIPGLVSVADVAPTALGREGGLESKPGEAGVAELRELDDRIRSNGDVRLAATILICALVLGLALIAPAAAVPGLAAALLANLALGILDVSDFWTVLAVLGVAVALGGPVLAALFRPPLALGLLLVAVVAAYLVALAADGATVALSPLGPSQNARYFGLSNLLETMLLLPALAGAALLHRRLGWVAFAGVALLTFVTVAGNRFGADGGGAIVLAVGFAVLGVLLAGARWRALVVALAGAAALTAGLVAIDVATGGESHVTEALGDGPVELARDLGDRISLSFARATQDWYVGLLLALLLLALGLLVARTFARRGIGSETAVPLALAAALAASLVVNDSPNDVLLVGVVSYLAADVGMLPARWPVSSHSSSPFSRSPWPRAAAAGRSPRPRPRP